MKNHIKKTSTGLLLLGSYQQKQGNKAEACKLCEFAIITVNIDQCRGGIGLFYGKVYVSIKVFNTNICLSSVCQNLF